MTLQPRAVREKLSALPVVKSGLSLMTGTMVTSGLGLIFWILAANLYDPADFGVSTTAVYTMMMLADVACLGLRTGLVRYIPQAGRATSRTIVWGYGLVLGASTITGIGFLIGLGLWAPDLVELRNSVLLFIFFVASTAFWALFMLEDAVLVGLRKAPWVPIENSIFGVLKIVLLFPLAKLSPTLGIFWAWTLPVFPIVFGVNVFVARVSRSRSVAARPPRTPWRPLLQGILSFSLADWLAALARLVALGVIPLMVLAQEGKVEAGYFQAAWLIAFTIFALSSNAAYALLAETSYEQASLHRNSLQAGLLSLALTLPVIVVGLVGAPLLLLIYGSEYADNSSAVLRILLLAAIPNVIHQLYIGRLRSQGRMGGVVFFETLLSALVVALAWLLLPRYGIDGVGLAWLIGLAILAVYASVDESLWWWAGRLDTRLVRRVGGIYRRLRPGGPARGMDSRLGGVLISVDVGRSDITWLASGDHGQTAIVSVDRDQELVIDFARSAVGATELERRRVVVEELLADPRLTDLHPLLPRLEVHGGASDQEFMAWNRDVTPTALDLLRRGVSVEEICRTALDALRPLHRVTGRSVQVAKDDLEHWIEQPINHLLTEGRASENNVGRLREMLGQALCGTTIEVGLVHGEFAVDNILMSAEPCRVHGLMRWEWSREAPIVLDAASLALSHLAFTGNGELGSIVRALLHDITPFEQHPAMTGQNEWEICPRTAMLLAWLNLVGRPLPPRRTMSSEVFWLARNARPVLTALEPLAGVDR